MLKIKREEENPSRRFFCLDKDSLDNFLNNIEKLRKAKSDPNLHLLSKALVIYIEQRKKVGCVGCTKGEHSCMHWSPAKEDIF